MTPRVISDYATQGSSCLTVLTAFGQNENVEIWVAKKEAPEVSFHGGEVQVICGFGAPRAGGTSVTFAEDSHCAQN